uniref:Uncharacterized protein n=1 Tax=Arundo donax TaxID=35708 RepID=A0A0A8ZP39_ARUDO
MCNSSIVHNQTATYQNRLWCFISKTCDTNIDISIS